MYLRILTCFLLLILYTLAQSEFNTSECGSTKHCVMIPPNCHENPNEECQFMVSHAPSIDNKTVTIEMFSKKDSPETKYVALGFSTDTQMGSEAVAACYIGNDGKLHLKYNYNHGKSSEPAGDIGRDDASFLEGMDVGTAIYCKFQQAITPKFKDLPNLNGVYNLLLARGPVTNEGLQYHTYRDVVPSMTHLSKPLALTGIPSDITTLAPKGSGPFSLTSDTKLSVIKMHGFLMMLSWFAMIAVGIFSARYLRPATPDTKVGGLHLWFQIHRGINFTALLLILVAVALIFVGKDLTWTGPIIGASSEYNWNSGAIHTMFGIIAVALGLMQPIGALARCSPDHPKRPIFNWGHRILGLIAVLCALTATYIAVAKFRLWSDSEWPLLLIIFYIIIAVLLVLGLEVFSYIRSRSRRKVTINVIEMSHRRKRDQDGFESAYHSSNERTSKDKLVDISGFLFFMVLSIVFVLLIAYFLL